ncbi:MAG: ribonuclease Z [Flavobacterium sp.]
MKLTILGCYAATPRSLTNPTSQVLEIKNRLFLIDCGEGTQVQLRKKKLKFSKINHVFISHLHGDHFFGLIGLIATFGLLGRTNDLHIYGPKGIKEIIDLQLKLSNSWTNYKLFFHELESKGSEIIFEDEKVIVKTIPLKHRVYTNGFLFQEKIGERKLNLNAVKYFDIDTCYADLPLSYAFCSDTKYSEDIIPIIENVSVLYHESTFLDSEESLASKTMHSTAKEAAKIALKANAKQLILGHYSTRYESIDLFKEEATTIFKEVALADDGKNFEF